jgi:hypothetical protein
MSCFFYVKWVGVRGDCSFIVQSGIKHHKPHQVPEYMKKMYCGKNTDKNERRSWSVRCKFIQSYFSSSCFGVALHYVNVYHFLLKLFWHNSSITEVVTCAVLV